MNIEAYKIDFPINWIRTNIGNICIKIHYGFTAIAKEVDTGVKYLRITDITDSGIDWSKVPYCEIKQEDIEKYELEENDIVFARTGGTVGKSILIRSDVPRKTVFASYLIRLKASKNINSKLLAFFFLSQKYWQFIEMNKTGLKTNVNAQILSTIDIDLPPLNEQNRIAQKLEELFRELDIAKEKLHASLENIIVFKQLILQRAFEGKLTEEWRKKQKKLKTPKEIIDEINAYRQREYKRKLEEFKTGKSKIRPKEPKKITTIGKAGSKNINTVYLRLGDIFETTSGGTPSRDNPGYYSGEIPWVKSGELKNNTIYKTEEKITQEALDNSSAKLFPKGTLLVALYGATVGKLAFLGIEAATNQAVCGIFEMPFYNLRYLYFYLLYTRPELLEQSTGGAQPNISQTILNNQFIPLCSIEEQQEVVKQINELFSTADLMEINIEENIQRSEYLKDELLDRAFRGKLVDQDPNDEQASILLEKIKMEREEFLKVEVERKKTEKSYYIKDIEMTEVLKSIIEILKENNEPVHAKKLWQLSVHKGDIDEFYAELKKLMENGEIEEAQRVGKDSFIKLSGSK